MTTGASGPIIERVVGARIVPGASRRRRRRRRRRQQSERHVGMFAAGVCGSSRARRTPTPIVDRSTPTLISMLIDRRRRRLLLIDRRRRRLLLIDRRRSDCGTFRVHNELAAEIAKVRGVCVCVCGVIAAASVCGQRGGDRLWHGLRHQLYHPARPGVCVCVCVCVCVNVAPDRATSGKSTLCRAWRW